MVNKKTIQFLKDLQNNNNREWFAAHKSQFEEAKADVLVFAQKLIEKVGEFDPAVADLQAKQCVFRIYRDVRFSKKKEPYKNNMGVHIVPGGKKSGKGGYYIHIEPGACFYGGGMYSPDSSRLKMIRQEIDYNTDEFRGVIGSDTFKAQFEGLEGSQLKTAPRGYAKDHPAIDLLRYKGFLATKKITEKSITSKGFIEDAVEVFKAMKPLNDFLNRAIDN